MAYELEKALRSRGCDVRNFTLESIGLASSASGGDFYGGKLRLLRDVLAYSILGTLKLRRSGQWHRTICHTDALYGKVYVNHGLHRAALDASGRKWLMLLRNPLHIFLWIREWARFRFAVHRYHVCFSETDAALLAHYFPRVTGKVKIIPNGVNTDRFFPDRAARQRFRSEHHFSDDDLVLCFVGHEFERKGLVPAIEALGLLPDRVKLVVAGGRGQMLQRAQNLAASTGVSSRVTFLGTVSNVESVINGSDALVLPSKYESWALVGLEAMACGLPALMKPTGGIPEYLRDGLNGFYIEDRAEDIAEKVQSLLGMTPVQRSEMRQAALHTAAQYSWGMIAERYLALLNDD